MDTYDSHDSSATPAPANYEGVGSALAAYIRSLEPYPTFKAAEELRRARELEQAKFPLYLTLWLSGYDYLAPEYRDFVMESLKGRLPAEKCDCHPNPVLVCDQYDHLLQVAGTYHTLTPPTPTLPSTRRPDLYVRQLRAFGDARHHAWPDNSRLTPKAKSVVGPRVCPYSACTACPYVRSLHLGPCPHTGARECQHHATESRPQRLAARKNPGNLLTAATLASATARLRAERAKWAPGIFGILTPKALMSLSHRIAPSSRAYFRARNEFAMHNGRLVIKLASGFRKNDTSLMDLIQEGNKGLLRAIDRFNHRLGHKFSTYATWWIRQQISRYLAEQTTIKIPSHIIDLRNKINRWRDQYYLQAGKEPTNADIGKQFSLPPKKVTQILDLHPSVTSMNERLGEESDAGEVGDRLVDPTSGAAEAQSDLRIMMGCMSDVLDTISARERNCISLRYGLKDGHIRTLSEVGRALGVTRERARQIEAAAIKKMRHPHRLRALNGERVPNSPALVPQP